MLTLFLALSLTQTSPAIRRTTPASDDPGMVVRQAGTVNVSCTNCSGGGTGDGGPTLVSQGAGADGGAWQVYVTNQTSSSLVLDGGSLGYMLMPDGGPLQVSIPSFVDTGNSTSTPLAGGASFTGATTYTRAAAIAVFAYSNVSSATNGLVIEFSGNGVNWDHDHQHTVTGGTEFLVETTLRSPYYRVRYTNGASAQAAFRLVTMTRDVVGAGTITTVRDVPTDDDHAQVTQSIIIGRTTAGGGSYIPVKVNPSGALTVDATQGSSPWLVAGRDGGAVTQFLPPTGTTTVPGTAVDLDTSGATRWAQGVAITGFGFGAGNQLTADVYSIPPSGFSTGLGVREVHKTVSNPTTTSVTCATTATAITSLAYRTTLTLKNPADADVVVYIGGSGVTTANGFPLYPRESWQDTVADSTYYCRSGNPDGGTAALRVLQN